MHQGSLNLTALADAPHLAEDMVPGMEKALHTELWGDDSQLSHILGTWNSEMNKMQSLLPGNSQSRRQTGKQSIE